MDAISYSAFRAKLARTLDKINDDHKPVLITRQNGKPAVVMSLEDFQGGTKAPGISPDNHLKEQISEIK